VEVGARRHLFHLPKKYEEKDDQKFPLLLFLHGGGKSANDINKVKKHVPPAQTASGREFPFTVLAPQNPYKKRLRDDTAAILLLDEIVERYRLVRNRVYLLGLSRGGLRCVETSGTVSGSICGSDRHFW